MTLAKLGAARLAVAEGLYAEESRERIHGLGTYAVQTHGFLEGLAVVLTAGVEQRNGFHHLAQGNTASIVAYAYHLTFAIRPFASRRYVHFDHLTFAHAELVDRVVDGLLDQHVYTVVGVGTVAQFTDIHTGSAADMFAVVEVDDILIAIVGSRLRQLLFCHNMPNLKSAAKVRKKIDTRKDWTVKIKYI